MAPMQRHLRIAALAAALFAGGWEEVCGQRDDSGTRNDRVLFSVASVSTLKDGIGAARPDIPYSNDARLPNASVIKVLDTDTNPTPTGQALAPWHGPLMQANSLVGVGMQTMDEDGQRIFTLRRKEDGTSVVESLDLITGGERNSAEIPFFPISGMSFYKQAPHDGLIVTLQQRCGAADGRWCRARVGVLETCKSLTPANVAAEGVCNRRVPGAHQTPATPPSYGNTYAAACAVGGSCVHSAGIDPILDHGLSAAAFDPITGVVKAEVDLPTDVVRVQSGLSAMDEMEGKFYVVVLRTTERPAIFKNHTHVLCLHVDTRNTVHGETGHCATCKISSLAVDESRSFSFPHGLAVGPYAIPPHHDLQGYI